jgi:hypothetical protein
VAFPPFRLEAAGDSPAAAFFSGLIKRILKRIGAAMRSSATELTASRDSQAGAFGYLTVVMMIAGLMFTWAALCAL